MKVSPAGLGDAGRLARLHARAFDSPWTEDDIAQLLRSAGALSFMAEDGFIILRALGLEAEILTLAVAPEARRRGAGRALVDAALGAARSAEAETVFLEVAPDNLAARALYEAAGFRSMGVRRGYYPRPGGRAVDALTLRRPLNSPPG